MTLGKTGTLAGPIHQKLEYVDVIEPFLSWDCDKRITQDMYKQQDTWIDAQHLEMQMAHALRILEDSVCLYIYICICIFGL